MSAHRITIAATLGLAGLGAGLTPAVAATPTTGAQLRAALPDPDDKDLAGATEFVGNAGPTALAVVVHRSGAAIAFLCDGRKTWTRFAGKVRNGRLDLQGTKGARLTSSAGGTAITVTVRRRGTTAKTFKLRKAAQGAGLRRLVVSGLEAEWVTTNSGLVKGVATKAGTARLATNSSAATTDQGGDVTDPGTGGNVGSGDVTTRGFINRIRCGVIVLKHARAQGAALAGTGSLTAPQEFQQQFGENNCFDEGFAL
ncbi:MAG TPA: hypothetical protein VD931_06895 [Baekduia sp.]|nr:hypothetical protein [Baekduia sp.]